MEELETFNYPLTSAEITANFERIQSMGTDLNGVPDLLENIALSSPTPFTRVPMAVTGVFQAERFDRGGRGQQPIRLRPSSETQFFISPLNTEVTFHKNANGEVKSLSVWQEERQTLAEKKP